MEYSEILRNFVQYSETFFNIPEYSALEYCRPIFNHVHEEFDNSRIF